MEPFDVSDVPVPEERHIKQVRRLRDRIPSSAGPYFPPRSMHASGQHQQWPSATPSPFISKWQQQQTLPSTIPGFLSPPYLTLQPISQQHSDNTMARSSFNWIGDQATAMDIVPNEQSAFSSQATGTPLPSAEISAVVAIPPLPILAAQPTSGALSFEAALEKDQNTKKSTDDMPVPMRGLSFRSDDGTGNDQDEIMSMVEVITISEPKNGSKRSPVPHNQQIKQKQNKRKKQQQKEKQKAQQLGNVAQSSKVMPGSSTENSQKRKSVDTDPGENSKSKYAKRSGRGKKRSPKKKKRSPPKTGRKSTGNPGSSPLTKPRNSAFNKLHNPVVSLAQIEMRGGQSTKFELKTRTAKATGSVSNKDKYLGSSQFDPPNDRTRDTITAISLLRTKGTSHNSTLTARTQSQTSAPETSPTTIMPSITSIEHIKEHTQYTELPVDAQLALLETEQLVRQQQAFSQHVRARAGVSSGKKVWHIKKSTNELIRDAEILMGQLKIQKEATIELGMATQQQIDSVVFGKTMMKSGNRGLLSGSGSYYRHYFAQLHEKIRGQLVDCKTMLWQIEQRLLQQQIVSSGMLVPRLREVIASQHDLLLSLAGQASQLHQLAQELLPEGPISR